jgi:beta-lactamase regulating signal transducer with metallopeptidase domain/thiol-disulfide isomerase/thioredoxin
MNVPFEMTGSLELVWRATWQAVLLATVVWIAVSVFRRWLTPRWRTLLWTIPLLRFCLLILPASSVSVYGLIALPYESETPPPARSIALSEAPQFPADRVLHPSASFVDPDEPAFPEEEFVASKPLPDVTAAPVDGWKFSTADVFNFVWIAGVVIIVIHWSLSRMFLRRMLSRCRPLEDRELNSWIEQQCYNLDTKRRIRYLVTDEDAGPASCGLWRPVIILPQQLLNELTREEVQTVVRHEVVHIRRWDGLLLILSRIATAIHWFNPLVYYLRRRLRREMELAVDATAVRGLPEQSRKAYGELLLRLSQRPPGRFGLVEMANSRSAVGKRIDQIFAPPEESRLSTAFAVGLIALLTVSGLSEAALTQEEAPAPVVEESGTKQGPATETSKDPKAARKYYVEGTVRDATDQTPVAGAEIRLFLDAEPDVDKKVRRGKTDQNGNYRIEVPLGDVRLRNPLLKPGYWLKPEDAIVSLKTTPDQPVVTHNLVVEPGPVWNVKVNGYFRNPDFRFVGMYEVADDSKRAAWLKGESVRFQKANPSSLSLVDENGNGKITEPGKTRHFVLTASTELVELIADLEFDNTRVVSVKKLNNSEQTVLIDANGHKATVSNASVSLKAGIPLLKIDGTTLESLGTQKLTGQIVDSDNRPLNEVKIGFAFGHKGGSGMQIESVQTDSEGRFTAELPVPPRMIERADEHQVKLVLTKDGFAGKDSRYHSLSTDLKPIDVGTITMQPGYSLTVKVLDAQGKPAAGAIVTPGDSYALRSEAVRTDEAGRAVVRNLPAGRLSLQTSHGNLHQRSDLVVIAEPDQKQELTIRVKEFEELRAEAAQLKPIPLGSLGPEFDVKQWSDGKQRKLSDYRGKVVVLEFWGIWCSPCISTIPMMQKLADRYETQGVVFLAIHTADGDLNEINKLRKQKQWKTPTAIDSGATLQESVTSRVYGVRGLPGVIILNREGKVAFHSGIEPDDPQTYQSEIAKLAGVSWPPADDLSEEEQIALGEKIFTALFSREIERVLKSEK